MSSKPIMYTSRDTGSLQINQIAVNYMWADTFKKILVSALVTGYGDKKPAGWKLVHEHKNGFTLCNKSETFFFNFVSGLPAQGKYPAMHNWIAHVYASTGFAGSDGGKMIGANLCSGTFREGYYESSNYSRHSLRCDYVFWPALSPWWSIVADESTFVFNATSESPNASSGKEGSPRVETMTLYVGKATSFTGIDVNVILGGDTAGYSGTMENYGISSRGFTMPINPINGLSESVDRQSIFPDDESNPRSGGVNYGVIPYIELCSPNIILNNSAVVGNLRGVVNNPFLGKNSNWMGYLEQLGHEPVYENTNKIKVVDGYNYCYARQASCGGIYMTDNPGFW